MRSAKDKNANNAQTYAIELALPKYVADILMLINQRGFEAFIVGGCVRDSLLGLTPKDWDITSNATPTQIQQIFSQEAKYKILPIGIQYGTLGILDTCAQAVLEITTYRTDGVYADGRRPQSVCFAKTLRQDVLRRDFTINALACQLTTHAIQSGVCQNPQDIDSCTNESHYKKEVNLLQKSLSQEPLLQEILAQKSLPQEIQSNLAAYNKTHTNTLYSLTLFDYCNGIADLHVRIIMCVGDSRERFMQDSLRILRALRFSATLPFGFTLHDETKEAIHALHTRLKHIAKERIYAELKRLLCGRYAFCVVPLYYDIFLFLFPFTRNLAPHWIHRNAAMLRGAPNDFAMRLALLFCPDFSADYESGEYIQAYKRACEDLRFENALIQTSSTLIRLLCATYHAMPTSMYETLCLLTKHDMDMVMRLFYLHVLINEANSEAYSCCESHYTLHNKLLEELRCENFHEACGESFANQTTPYLHNDSQNKAQALCMISHNLITIIKDKKPYRLSHLAINGTILQEIAASMGVQLQGKQIGFTLQKLLDLVLREEIPNNETALKHKAKHYLESNEFNRALCYF